MDGGAGNTRAPEYFCLTSEDGIMVPYGVFLRGGGFTFPVNEEQCAAAKATRQMDHYRRVQRNARLIPKVAAPARLGSEGTLVDLMYGDVEEFVRLVEGSIVRGPYAV